MSLAIVFVLYVIWLACFFGTCYKVCSFHWQVLVLIGGLIAGYFVHMACVIGYWELELAFAKSESQLDRVVSSDGASLVFNAMFLAPATSVVVFILGIFVVILTPRERFNFDMNAECEIIVQTSNLSSKEASNNPYDPPHY